MENKADVKAIMARFQASGSSTDETSSAPGGRPKQPLHSSLSSGSVALKKPLLESHSGSAGNIPPKPSFLKNTVSSKSDTDPQETNKTKALASRFATPQEDANTNSKPVIGNKPLKPPLEPKVPGQKPPFSKPPLSSTLSETKPVFPKPPVAVGSKPSWVKEDSGGGAASNTSPTQPKIPSLQPKPSNSIGKLRLQSESAAGSGPDAVNKPAPQINSSLKPSSNFKAAQNMFNKEKDKAEQTDSGGTNKPPLTATNSLPPPKPPASKKPSMKKPSQAAVPTGSVNGDDSGPKRNPLLNSLALGPAPAKPNRPPKVNLDRFKRAADSPSDGPAFRKPKPLTPMASHPSNHMTQGQPPPPALPSLPPRHPGTMNQQDEVYDDIEDLSNSPPPLPPTAGHPSQRAKEEYNDDDGETYEDLDDHWEAAEREQEKKKEKAEKEEKKRQEAEKKEQKEREKKEQEARKKFKLVGLLEVIHQGKALTDCKGSKYDLALKQGDSLDIIRLQGNPEGKWLGRAADGSIGYVKTTSVNIDYNALKNCKAQQAYEPELYDDIDVLMSENSANKGPGVVLPPLPGDGGEIYDDCVDPNLDQVSPADNSFSTMTSKVFQRMFDRNRRSASTKVLPPPSQFTADGNPDVGSAIDDEIYDDVDAQGAPPPPPPLSSLPAMKGKGRAEEMDPRKQKKFEKEEKEFRKKFKYEGGIQVLYQVNVIPMLTNKKWGNKELSIKAGETLDVIVKAVDNKLICRNEEGKYGYVSTSHIAMDDGDIYDDIGDDCIYDND